MKQLLGIRGEIDREENAIIQLFSSGYISLEKFRERKAILVDRAKDTEARIAEIEQRQGAREQARADPENVQQLCEDIKRGLPILTQELSFDDKRFIMDTMHIKITAKSDGDIRIAGALSDDILALSPERIFTQSKEYIQIFEWICFVAHIYSRTPNISTSSEVRDGRRLYGAWTRTGLCRLVRHGL